MRRPAVRWAGATAAVLASGLLLVPGASADAPDATGWWAAHRFTPPKFGLPTGEPPLDRPDPTVPDGGLYVAGEHATAPDAPPNPAPQRTGISALRLGVGDAAAVGELVLTFHKENGRDRAEGLVAIQACPSTIVWTPDEGGPITSAPPHDCSTGLAFGTVDGSTVRIPVGGLVRNGMLNIVLMPQPGSAFQAVFAKPGPNAIVVTRYPRPTENGGGGGGGTETTCTTCLPPTVTTVPFVPRTDPVGEILALPPAPAATTTTLPPPSDEDTEAISRVDGQRPGDEFRLEGWQQALAGGVLALLAALYVVLMRLPQRSPRLLGAAASGDGMTTVVEVARGIGRFARPRTGPPPQL